MDCPDPQRCAEQLLDWIKGRLGGEVAAPRPATAAPVQGILWATAPYQEEAPAIRSAAELAGALEHLEYATFRRNNNQLTRAERARLDNTIDNALFKAERYLARLDEAERGAAEARCRALRDAVRDGRERAERLRSQARRADLKLAQLDSLDGDAFEGFVAEVFEALGYAVEPVGGTGDEGADLIVTRAGLRGVVQCKYQKKAVVGSPVLQKFLGTVHHTRSHKGFFVTTSTFTLAAEKFVAEHPIELIDGPRLVELVREAMGPGARRDPEPSWF
jgi:restriction system protein